MLCGIYYPPVKRFTLTGTYVMRLVQRLLLRLSSSKGLQITDKLNIIFGWAYAVIAYYMARITYTLRIFVVVV